MGRNQEAEMWTKWGEVLRKKDVNLIIIVHINFHYPILFAQQHADVKILTFPTLQKQTKAQRS